MLWFRTVLLTLLLLPGLAHAEVRTWTCAFRGPEASQDSEPLRLVFKYDTVTTRAYIEGNAGIEDVQYHAGYAGLTFLEPLISGAVQSTTITKDGPAVHSRNTVIGGHIVASQLIGTCEWGRL